MNGRRELTWKKPFAKNYFDLSISTSAFLNTPLWGRSHTLVTYQQARAALEAHSSTLLMGTRSVEIWGSRGRGTKPGHAAKGKFKNYTALMENGISQ